MQRVRLLAACERAGLPLHGSAAAVGEGRLSLDFLEAAPYRRWATRSIRTYRQVSQDTGIPLDTLGSVLESMGFARMAPDEPIQDDELEDIVPMLQLAYSMEIWTMDLPESAGPGRRACGWPLPPRIRTTPAVSGGCWSLAQTFGMPRNKLPGWQPSSCRSWTVRS